MKGPQLAVVSNEGESGTAVAIPASQLATHVVFSSPGTIPLPNEVLKGTIIPVTVDDQSIPASEYSLNSSGIYFSQAIRERVGALRLAVRFKASVQVATTKLPTRGLQL